MKNRILQIIETLLLLFCSIQCGRAIYARYAEFLSQGKIVPSFLAICVILLGGTLLILILIWKTGWLASLAKLKSRMTFISRAIAFILCLIPGFFYNFIHSSEPYQGLWIRIFLSRTGINTYSLFLLEELDGSTMGGMTTTLLVTLAVSAVVILLYGMITSVLLDRSLNLE